MIREKRRRAAWPGGSVARRALAAVVLVGGALAAGPLAAAEIEGFDRPVELAAREQPVGRFVEELLGQVGVPARVDESIVGTVNGDFDAPASRIFDDIAQTFQLTMYYDGAMAWVYPANGVVRDLLYLPGDGGRRVVDAADSLGMTDARNRVESSAVGLVVTGTERFVEQVRELAVAVERDGGGRAAPAPRAGNETVMEVFELRYAWAGDVTLVVGNEEVLVPGVASLLRELVEPGAVRGVSSVRRTRQGDSLDGLRGQGLQSNGASGSDELAPGTTAALPARDGGSTLDTRIVADTLSNSVVVRDRSDRMADYAELIAALDVEPDMVEIEATIIDLNTDRLRELGINWRVQGDEAEGLFGEGTLADRELVEGGDIAGRGQGGVVSLVLGDSTRFLARIRALESQGAARVVSKPHVMTLSNVEALLDTTSTFFVRVEGQEEVDLFDVSVGTTLRVTPHVFEGPNGTRIKLRVAIEDGSTTDRTVDRIPVVERSTINTQALIDEEESLLIGGLVREINAEGISKVPVLGSLPVVGALFRNTTQTSSRLERMFLITPRLNLRPSRGLRYDAPVAAGREGDIIRSVPTRLEPALAGVASRDAARALTQPLPTPLNGGDVRLVPAGQPLVEELPPPAAAPLAPRERTLRERLGLEQAPEAPPTDTAPAREPARPRWIEVPAPETLPLDPGWQEVGAPLAAPVPAPRPVANRPVPLDTPALDVDAWQEVGG